MQQVGIIGGAGFIGSYITKIFLEQGFRVKVSATDLAKKERYRHLTQLKNSANLGNTNFPLPPGNKAATDAIDENDVKFISGESHPYGQAKFIANQTVEQFVLDNPTVDFEIISVSPVFVMGRSLSDKRESTSVGMQMLLKDKIAPNPFVQMMYDQDLPFAGVDVADVADSVYKAAITKGLHGRNYLLSSETYQVSDITRMLNGIEPLKAPVIVYRNDLVKKELNVNFRPVKETLNAYTQHH